MMGKINAIAIAAGVGLASRVSGQACNTTTLQNDVPASGGPNVTLKSFSYYSGTLNVSSYIANLGYNKTVTLYYTNALGQSTPLSSVSLGYDSSVANDYELWTSSSPVCVDGITELLNITYQANEIGATYSEQLGQKVVASGNPAPTLPSPPTPDATPKGFQDDIPSFQAVADSSQLKRYFTLSALAQYFWSSTGKIAPTNTSRAFSNFLAPTANLTAGQASQASISRFAAVINSLNGWADAFMRTIKHYTASNGRGSEEVNRNTGVQQDYVDSTCSHASTPSAAKLRGQNNSVKDLANLGNTENG